MTTLLENGVHGFTRIKKADLLSVGEDRFQFMRRDDFQLFERAVRRLLVCAPATELCGVAKTIALHVVVRDLYDQLRSQWLPR